MWIWERERRRVSEEPAAQLGVVTLGEGETAVNLGGERRWLGVCAPSGYSWRPRQGEQVLVLKSGQEAWVLGVVQSGGSSGPAGLYGEECSIELDQGVQITGDTDVDGTLRVSGPLRVSGAVEVEGQGLEDFVRSIVNEVLSGG